ncbi:MAG: hypothetical protein ACREL9_04290 [Gemmatimonadales bacterium]
MMDDRFDDQLREAAQDYHRPPATPREELWARIEAARTARREMKPVVVLRPWLRWGLGIAAILVLGIGIGRWTAGPGRGRGVPPVAQSEGRDRGDASSVAYRVAATQYLSRTEAFLTDFRTRARVGAGRPDGRFAASARDLLTLTRLMLDSPAADDARLRALLEDLELVLVQIARLTDGGTAEEVDLITQGLEHRGVLTKLRTAIPAGPAPASAQGEL